MVFGQARSRPTLLLEANDPSITATEVRKRLLNRICPTVERANQRYEQALRITRDYVLFTTAEKSMVWIGKGSVQRIHTILEFEKDIDTLYDDLARQEKACEESLGEGFWKNRVGDEIIIPYI